MAGYSDMDRFTTGMNSSTLLVPCMKKQFGASFCPHCAEANALYEQARNGGGKAMEDAGSKKYFKKQYFCLGILTSNAQIPQNGQICLVHLPSKVTETVVSSIQHNDPRLAWPVPDSLPHGRALLLEKFKKDAQFNDYRVSLDQNETPLEQAWFESVRASLPNIKDNVSFLEAYYGWGAANKFEPAKDMQVGSVVSIRVLPPVALDGSVPFCMQHFHYVEAMSKWDTAWADLKFDISREAEAMQRAGFAAPQHVGVAGGYAAGAPGVHGAPGPSGVAAPGLAGLTGGASVGGYGAAGAPNGASYGQAGGYGSELNVSDKVPF